MYKVKYDLSTGKILQAGPLPDLVPDAQYGVALTNEEGVNGLTHSVDLKTQTLIERPADDVQKDIQDAQSARADRKKLALSVLKIPDGKTAEFIQGLRELFLDGHAD